MTDFARQYLGETRNLLESLDPGAIERVVMGIARVRGSGGRLFVLGVGGSAGHASHAVGDFRKLCGIESYAPTDNISELTARTNDDGWESCFVEWLKTSQLRKEDAVLVLSVGGGSRSKSVSMNIVRALELAKHRGIAVYGIVGRDGGATAELADACVLIPATFPDRVTPHTEGLCAVILHLIVSHPELAQARTKW